MMIQDANLALAGVTLILAAYIGWTHPPTEGHRAWIAVTVLTLFASLGVVTAIQPSTMGRILTVDLEVVRFVAAAIRAILIIILAGYALHVWRGRR